MSDFQVIPAEHGRYEVYNYSSSASGDWGSAGTEFVGVVIGWRVRDEDVEPVMIGRTCERINELWFVLDKQTDTLTAVSDGDRTFSMDDVPIAFAADAKAKALKGVSEEDCRNGDWLVSYDCSITGKYYEYRVDFSDSKRGKLVECSDAK